MPRPIVFWRPRLRFCQPRRFKILQPFTIPENTKPAGKHRKTMFKSWFSVLITFSYRNHEPTKTTFWALFMIQPTLIFVLATTWHLPGFAFFAILFAKHLPKYSRPFPPRTIVRPFFWVPLFRSNLKKTWNTSRVNQQKTISVSFFWVPSNGTPPRESVKTLGFVRFFQP